jgi:hypothetical protein
MVLHSIICRGRRSYGNHLSRALSHPCSSTTVQASINRSPRPSPIQPSASPGRFPASKPVYFSTSSSGESSSSGGDEAHIRESITELLRDSQTCPTGSLTPKLLKDAEKALESWVTERNRHGFEMASEVLMRLAQEQEFLERAAESRIGSDTQANMHHLEEDRYHVRPFLLNQVVDCWRTCWRDGLIDMPPSEILSVVDDLETRGLVPDSRTLTMIVDGMILRGNPFEAPLLGQWLLDRRMEQGTEKPSMRPDTVLITNVIRAWAKSGRLEATEMAQGLLHLMHDLHESGWIDSGPNAVSYAVTMEAWYRSRHRDSDKAIEKLLEEMKTSTVEQVFPDRICYTYVINGWANARSHAGPHKAYDLLQEMLHLYEAGNEAAAPDVSNFSRVMFALARRGEQDKVEVVFEQLQGLFSKTGDPRFKPNHECTKAMIIGLAKSGSAAEAQGVLDELIQRATTEQNLRLMPKRGYFVDVLVAWSKDKNERTAAEESEKLLMRMLSLAKSGHPDLMPDARCFEKVMQTWSKTRHEDVARKVESLLQGMDQVYKETGNKLVKPTGKAVELAVLAWSRSQDREAPERAEALIREMEQRYSSGDRDMKPSREVYTCWMLTWLRSGKQEAHTNVQGIFDKLSTQCSEGHHHLRPDLYVYSVLLDSWAQRGDAPQTQVIFDRMVDDYSRGNEDAKPDVHAFNKILKAYVFSKDPNRAQMAEVFYKKIQDIGGTDQVRLSPNRQTFNEMITVWSNSDEPNAAETSESYLRQLKDNNLEPTILSYRAAIDAWTRSKDSSAPARAEALLEELLRDVDARKVRLPLSKPYRRFLQAIARSKIPQRNKQAQELLESLPHSKVLHSLLPPL